MTAPVVLLVNPAAGRGRAARVATEAAAAIRATGLSLRIEETQSAGDEARIAAEACAQGARALAIVGGDGAINHAVRGLLLGPSMASACAIPVAIFAAGTGNDFVKSMTAPAHDVRGMAARLFAGATRRVDVGLVDQIPFVNAAGFGFDVHVLQRMLKPGLLRGTSAYVGTALRALLGYRGFTVRVGHVAASQDQQHLMLVLANGRTFGGAFRIAPQAQIDDGRLECIAIRDVPRWARVPLLARAIGGAHLTSRHVDTARAADFSLHFLTPPMFQVDGELHQATACQVRIGTMPGALTVIA